MQHEFDVAMQEKELNALKIEAEHERKETRYILAIFLVVLIAMVLTILLLSQRAKTIRNRLIKDNLELEKAKLSQELNYKNKELATNMMYLLEKNEFITSIAKKLGEMKLDLHKSIQPQVQTMIKELKDNSSSKIWEEFEFRFKEVHTEFYDALYTAFPDLSPNEKRICAFLRLNMSTKEISSITHQSVKSINMARYRLRKRLNIDKDENLIQFLAQL
jgi:DNA-binding CsgD family transcriptional regulator